MPWKSKSQELWGNSPAGHQALGDAGVQEWNAASKGADLPEKVKAMKSESHNYDSNRPKRQVMSRYSGR